jgi:hypothetical protein
LPDEWERRHFGGLSEEGGAAGQDWDGDGLDNWGEFVAGTDPTNALSAFALAVEWSGGWPAVSFHGLDGYEYYGALERRYTLESVTNLMEGWFGVPGCTDVRGGDETVIHTNVGGGPTFFRGRTYLVFP